MSCKMGFVSATGSDIQTVKIIKQDLPSEASYSGVRCGEGDLQSVIYSQKSNIHLETDYMTTAEVAAVRNVLANRTESHKIFIKHPADAHHEYVFDATTNECFFGEDDLGTFTAFSNEFLTADYTNVNAFNTTPVQMETTGTPKKKYAYMQFTADISDFITNHTVNAITRITLCLRNVLVTDNEGNCGFKIDYLDNSYSPARYVEIKRQGYTVDANNTIFASIRPIDCFTNFGNSLDTNFVKFRIRNLYENRNTASAISVSVDFAKIYVNGYGCVWDEIDNFTYRDTYTGNGWTGNIDLIEL